MDTSSWKNSISLPLYVYLEKFVVRAQEHANKKVRSEFNHEIQPPLDTEDD